MRDYRNAPVSDAMKVLLAFIEKVVRNASRVSSADVEEVRAAGWSDAAIYDAITVCSLFMFYNTWVSASGVAPLADYVMSGRRLATSGYVP